MTETIVDEIFRRAEERPEHPAIIQQTGPNWSYETLRDRVRERSGQLRETYDCPRFARCGLVTDDETTFLVNALAVLHAGYCLLPVPESYEGEGLAEFRNRTGLHLLIDDRGSLHSTRYEDPDPVDGQDDEHYRDLDPAYVRFTSGTTGQRKGVLLGHRALLDRTKTVNRSLEVGPEDRILWLLDMQEHFVSSVLLYLRNGATILLPENHLPNTVTQFVENQKATFLYATPYQYEMMLGAAGASLGSVRLAISTASGLGESTAREFEETFGMPLTQALGIIEVGLPMVNLKRASEKPTSLGQVQPGYEVHLNTDGTRKYGGPSVGPGEFMVKGPGLFDTYLDPWLPATDVLEDGFFTTGDQGYFDDDGDFFLKGRRTNRINMAGMKFFCEEVETVLNSHPLVDVSRVMPEEHEKLGEIPVAEVVLSEGATLDEESLKDHCRGELESYKVPREFREVESIPRTDTGKIKRVVSDG